MSKFVTVVGSISRGTLRPQDLIPKFRDMLYVLDPEAYVALGREFRYGYGLEDDDPWWDSEDAGYLLEALFDALEEFAPDGYYFGAHPGDGSDFGYWPIENLPGGARDEEE